MATWNLIINLNTVLINGYRTDMLRWKKSTTLICVPVEQAGETFPLKTITVPSIELFK